MLTDRAPFEYRYLSSRLLADLFQHEEAGRRRLHFSGELSAWIAKLQVARAQPDQANLHALARNAERLVSDHTGSVSYTGAALYVKDQLPLRHGVFEPLMGWLGGKVACYAGEGTNDDGQQVFLALFGSASNVVGYRAEGGTGYCPSDMTGLYTMLDAVREPHDPQIDLDYLWDDGNLSRSTRADAAIQYAQGAAKMHIGPHEFLARVYLDVDNHRSGQHFTGQVIVGTPLWIATPRPRPDGH